MAGCPRGAKRWGARKIVNGTIRLGGKVFRPDEAHRPYLGELDGQWWVFARYPGHEPRDGREFIEMWGSKAYHDAMMAADDSEEAERVLEEAGSKEPNIIDGYYCWSTWREVAA